MRYLFPGLFLASPALAHPSGMIHGHGADWPVVFALVLIGVAAGAAIRAGLRG